MTHPSRFCLLLASLLLSQITTAAPPTNPVEVSSPDGHVRFILSAADSGNLTYSLSFRGRIAIEPSRLGLTLDRRHLGSGVTIGAITRDTRTESYPLLGGHALARDHSHGARIALRHGESGLDYALEVRAFSDGVGFRWIVPGGSGPRVPDAGTDFHLPAFSSIWVHDLAPHYEGVFTRKMIPGRERGRSAPPPPAELTGLPSARGGEWTVVPLVAKLPENAGYVCITESSLSGYAGMALQYGDSGIFRERLGHAHPPSYPYVLRYSLDEADRLAQPAAIDGPITTPWRVIMVAADLNGLVNSDIITNLAPPPDPQLFPEGPKTSWIRPGRALWKYLQPGESTPPAMKEYARLAGQLGFEHNVLEGFWSRWTMDERREVVAFSREHGVSIWFWYHSNQLRTAKARQDFFAMLADLGVVGAKIDFLDHEARETIELYDAILLEAARHKVMVNFHGANKPTGQSRTWPNEVTREAIHGFENSRTPEWSGINTTLPFTRFLAGPADYTPVMFSERRKETSWAHQIATACVFTSPLMVYGARPEDILANPAADLIKTMPAVWDETVVLDGSAIGEFAAFARRSGDVWFVGILNGPGGERTFDVPLHFLTADAYEVLAYHDVENDPASLRRETTNLSRGGALRTTMRAGGGFIAKFTPQR